MKGMQKLKFSRTFFSRSYTLHDRTQLQLLLTGDATVVEVSYRGYANTMLNILFF